MEILPLSLVILSAIIHALWNFFFKKSKDSTIFIFWAKIFEIIIYFPLVFYLLINHGLSYKGLVPVILSGIIHFFYWFFLSLGYNTSDLSLVYPVARSSPLLITLLSFLFFGEKITFIGFIGIILIILGIYFISINSLNFKDFLRIFNKKSIGLLFAFLTLITVTSYSLVDKIGAKYVNPIVYVYLFEIISLIPFSYLILIKKKKEELHKILKSDRISIIFTSVAIILSYSLIIFVMRISKLSYIVSIREIGIVFGVLLGIISLKEKYGLIRITSSILIFTGIILISLYG
ncbi:MAG: DMT family transporter [Caldisericia bacterium]